MFYRIDDLKNFANFIGKHMSQVIYERKSLTLPMHIHAACTLIIKETPVHSCFLVSSAEFSEYISFRTLLEECFDIFKSNKYMKVSFQFTVFYRESKTKKEHRSGSKTGKS